MKKFILLSILCIQVQVSYPQWIPVNNGMGNVSVEAMDFLGNNLFTATSTGIVYLSTNGGSNWLATSLNHTALSFTTTNGNKIFAGTSGSGVYSSTNNGSNWIQTALTNQAVWSMAAYGTNIFAGTNNFGVYLSTDNGFSWNQKGLNNRFVLSLATNGSYTFAGLYLYGIYSTTNNGANWVSISGNTTVWSLAVNGNNVYAGTRGDGMFATTNNGSNWSNVLSNVGSIFSLAVNGNNIFSGADSGVFVSSNNGGNWVQRNEGLPSGISINALIISDNYVYAGTWGRGVYKRFLNEFSAIHYISNEIPNQFSLSQNYPNPFNPVTNIKFSVPKSGLVKLTVYDAAGRETATLFNGRLSAGTYNYDFDASQLASGIYFYKLETNEFTQTKKMVLIK